MIFKLYRIRQPEGHYLYEYSINDLCGRYDGPTLNQLIEDMKTTNSSLLLASLQTTKDFYLHEVDHALTDADLTPLFTSHYKDKDTLIESLLSDVRSAIPEHLV